MSAAAGRQVLAQCAIIAAVCGGGWMMFVEPTVKEVRVLEDAIRAGETTGGVGPAASVETVAARLSDASARLVEIGAANEASGDTPRLYGEIMSLAARHGVTVHSVQPGQGSGADGGPVSVTRIQIVLDGPWDKVADFLDGVERLEGNIRPQSLTLSALEREGGRLASAKFSIDALEFRIPEALASVEVKPDAEP